MKPKCCTFVQALAACDPNDRVCVQHAQALFPGNCPVLMQSNDHLSDYCVEAAATMLSAPSTEKQTLYVNPGAQQQPWMVALLAGVAGMTGGAVVLALDKVFRQQGRDPPLLSEA